MHLTPIDVLFLGIFIYLIVKRFLNQKRDDQDQQRKGPRPSDLRPKPGTRYDTPAEDDDRKQATEAYQRAQQAWDMLRSEEPAQAAQQGFNEAEFIEGAKLMCMRIRESWNNRDLDDLDNFCTPEMMQEFSRRAESETRPPKSEVLLVKAELAEISTPGNGLEEASVLYDILEKQSGNDSNNESREMWNFVRAEDDPSSMWQLRSMRPVTDGSDSAPQ